MRSKHVLRILVFFFVGILFSACWFPALANENKTIRIGVLDTLDPEFYVHTFAPTMEYLRKQNPKLTLSTIELDFKSLLKASEEKAIDFFIASSGFYGYAVELAGAQHIATRRNPFAKDPMSSVATTFIARRDDDRIREVKDIQDKRIGAYNADSFAGWIVALAHFKEKGLNLEQIGKNTIFSEFSSPDLLILLTANKIDVAILPACELETLTKRNVVKPGEIKILDERKDSLLTCKHSTDLYPDIVFASLPGSHSKDVEQIALSLLSMPETERGIKWGLSNSFKTVTDIYKNLEIGPFDNTGNFTLWNFYNKNKKTFLAIILVLAFILLHSILLNVLVKKRTKQLVLALKEREELQKQVRESLVRINEMERYGLVSFMSNLLMHEIRQPITALINFSHALSMYLKQKHEPDPEMSFISEQISSESKKISGLINRIRSYAKGENSWSVISLNSLVDDAVNTFRKSQDAHFLTVKNQAGNVLLNANKDEIELVIINLLKNAETASRNADKPKVTLTVEKQANNVVLRVSDNGPSLNQEDFDSLSNNIKTTKKDGFGLGLMICRLITEKHGGHLEFHRLSPCGLEVIIVLPVYEEKDHAKSQD